jgi:type II secretory ATPase GspE/PulE/Tfp pilus assembly ATPase PilB-like protein
VDIPSFAGFPWFSCLLCGLFCLTVACLAGAATWVRRTAHRLKIAAAPRWNLIFGGLCLAFLIGTVTVGLPALGGAWVMLLPALVAFTRRRDAQVEESKRYLSARGFANIMADVKAARRRGAATQPTVRLSLRQQVTQLIDRVRAAAATGRKRPSRSRGAAAAAAKPPPGFAFLKKDGTVAIELTAEGDCHGQGAAVSENVCNARNVMLKGISTEATDLHLEPHEQQYYVRARVDGVLRDASTPTSYGEKVVMRLLRSSGSLMTGGLGSIGLRPAVLKQLREIIHKPYGMFLVVGPTGSGKTTTVYASLSEIDAHRHNITTIEDPVEYRLDNITQIAVNTKADVSFASILRSVLRQDPDVLLVGEIRDKETAEIACQAALTGHFVFSTLHANDSVATITRLLDLGLEPTLIQTAITAVLGQRLARRLCPACKEPCEPPAGMLKKFKLQPGAVPHIYREKGCEQCGGTGYRGRLGIHELLVMNNSIRSLVTPSPSIVDLKKAAVESGTLTLQIDGLLKVIQGDTSVNEVLRVTN